MNNHIQEYTANQKMIILMTGKLPQTQENGQARGEILSNARITKGENNILAACLRAEHQSKYGKRSLCGIDVNNAKRRKTKAIHNLQIKLLAKEVLIEYGDKCAIEYCNYCIEKSNNPTDRRHHKFLLKNVNKLIKK